MSLPLYPARVASINGLQASTRGFGFYLQVLQVPNRRRRESPRCGGILDEGVDRHRSD